MNGRFSTMGSRIVHLTSVHPRSDIRIFSKQCRSLETCGYDVSLVVADGKGDAYDEGIKVIDVGRPSGRLNRIFKTTRRIYQIAVDLDADVYHFHDPELIPIGLKLKCLGKKVIFDAHEDVPKQLLAKPYLNSVLLRILSGAFSVFEQLACRQFDGIIAATPFIRDKFLGINPNTLDINNFPMIGELDATTQWKDKHDEFCYVGAIGVNRGIREIIFACEFIKTAARLNLAGSFYEPDVEVEVKSYAGWRCVNELGYLDRSGVRAVLERSVVGLVTLHPVINYLDALPVKMFEYMAAGIPVIASDFPLWREIIEGNQCGICVDPFDSKAIAAAIDLLIKDRDLARYMGENGRRAVEGRYNWRNEERKLLDFYDYIVSVRKL